MKATVTETMIDSPGSQVERRCERYKVDLRLKVYMQRNGQRIFVFGQGSDVSEAGMAAYLPAELQISDKVEIEVKLPYSKSAILIAAEVRNRNGFRYGLEFLQMDAEDKVVLGRSLRALSLVQ